MGQEHHGREQAVGYHSSATSSKFAGMTGRSSQGIWQRKERGGRSMYGGAVCLRVCAWENRCHTRQGDAGELFAVDEAGEGGCGGFLSFSDR